MHRGVRLPRWLHDADGGAVRCRQLQPGECRSVLAVPCWFGVQRRVSNRLWWLSRRTVHSDDRVDELLFVRRRSVLVCRERDVV